MFKKLSVLIILSSLSGCSLFPEPAFASSNLLSYSIAEVIAFLISLFVAFYLGRLTKYNKNT